MWITLVALTQKILRTRVVHLMKDDKAEDEVIDAAATSNDKAVFA